MCGLHQPSSSEQLLYDMHERYSLSQPHTSVLHFVTCQWIMSHWPRLGRKPWYPSRIELYWLTRHMGLAGLPLSNTWPASHYSNLSIPSAPCSPPRNSKYNLDKHVCVVAKYPDEAFVRVGCINDIEDRGELITKMLVDTHAPGTVYCSCSSWYTYCGYVSLIINVLPGNFKCSSWCALNMFH